MFGLCVRFTCKDEASRRGLRPAGRRDHRSHQDQRAGNARVCLPPGRGPALAADLLRAVPGRAAFEAHEASPHTRRYLEARGQYLASTEVDWLTLQTGKGTGG